MYKIAASYIAVLTRENEKFIGINAILIIPN
jgi:hypothetical protein